MQIAEDYSHCEFLLRLPGYCPMPAFRDVIDVPLVVRSLRRSRSEVRKELGIGDDVKVVIYNFGGQKLFSLTLWWFLLFSSSQQDGSLSKNGYQLVGYVWYAHVVARILQDTATGKHYVSNKM
ncbi:hypothetical protein B296_00041262 [Ensete ventricosum]|uniref:Uncharacterized protein n=1 Tax=Ensete ventricosum TaxID=4639 RepID=A0A426YTV7_ENSVE|nr:hypothetical protein B296_00041262 [Ensete ventricosum]